MAKCFMAPCSVFEQEGKLMLSVVLTEGSPPLVLPVPADWPADRPAGWSGPIEFYVK